MWYRTLFTKNKLKVNTSKQGETIEEKVCRITTNKEPIKDGAPLIYTERKHGVQAGYNIRTDRFEVACEAMDKVTKSHLTKREERHKPVTPLTKDQIGTEKTGGQSIPATDNP